MNKFIDVDKLLAEIKELLKTAENNERDAFMKVDAEGHIIAVTKTATCLKIMNIITSLQRELTDEDLGKLVDEEFASHCRTTEYGLVATYNRAELYQFIKRMALVFNARKED